MFEANQLVKSKRTGFKYRVLGYGEPTPDGRETVLVYPVTDPMNIFTITADSVVEI